MVACAPTFMFGYALTPIPLKLVAPGAPWVVLNGLLWLLPPSACAQPLSPAIFWGVTGAPTPRSTAVANPGSMLATGEPSRPKSTATEPARPEVGRVGSLALLGLGLCDDWEERVEHSVEAADWVARPALGTRFHGWAPIPNLLGGGGCVTIVNQHAG